MSDSEKIEILCEIIEKQSSIIARQCSIIAELNGLSLADEIEAINALTQDYLGI